MVPKWIGLIAFVAIIMAIVGAAAQGSALTLVEEEGKPSVDPDIDCILSYTEAWQDNPWGTLVNPVAHARFFQALFGLLIGQQNLYAIFPQDSPWLWIWIIIWIPIIATVVFGILMLFFAILQRVIS